MVNLYIDPLILGLESTPNGNLCHSDVGDYIDQLLTLSDLSSLDWINIILSDGTESILFDENIYPLRENLSEIIRKNNVDYSSVNDLDTIINKLLQKSLRTPSLLSIQPCDYQDICVEPSTFISNRSNAARKILEELLMYMSIENQYYRSSPKQYRVIIKNNYHEAICISFNINDIDIPTLKLPIKISNEFQTYLINKELYTQIDPVLLWLHGNYYKAIEVSSCQLTQTVDTTSFNNFKLGDSFVKTVEHNFHDNYSGIKSLLRAISRIVTNRDLESTHALRRNGGGNTPQKTQGNFSAWRMDVDYEYHLHYWKYHNNIEFSNLVTHNDFLISPHAQE